jgi:p-aminobenzoyl-glutamate transporter AbgT
MIGGYYLVTNMEEAFRVFNDMGLVLVPALANGIVKIEGQ